MSSLCKKALLAFLYTTKKNLPAFTSVSDDGKIYEDIICSKKNFEARKWIGNWLAAAACPVTLEFWCNLFNGSSLPLPPEIFCQSYIPKIRIREKHDCTHIIDMNSATYAGWKGQILFCVQEDHQEPLQAFLGRTFLSWEIGEPIL